MISYSQQDTPSEYDHWLCSEGLDAQSPGLQTNGIENTQSGNADSKDTFSKEVFSNDTLKTIENKAIAYLARREYSRRELQLRLLQKDFPSSLVASALDNLSEAGYQSDERFTEMYIRSRAARGDGPFKIKIALRQKGVSDDLVFRLLDRLEINWLENARVLSYKKFGAQPLEAEKKAKQIRYLKNKGYFQEHIQAVVGQ